MVCKVFSALTWGLTVVAVVPFMTTVLFGHFFMEEFLGTSSAKQFIPQGQRHCISLWH